jgi:hypothetical protein
MGAKGRWEPLRFAGSGLGFAACWLLKQPRRQLPCHQMQRCKTLDLIRVLPGPHPRTTPLHAQGGVARRDQGKTRFLLAQQHALSLLGFFFHAVSSARAACCFSGSPRRERYVGREGRISWRGQTTRMAVRLTAIPGDWDRYVANAS